MKKLILYAVLTLFSVTLYAQTFEVIGMQEAYKGSIGDLIKAPLKLKNTSDKAITLILKKAESQIGSSQKSFFCPDNNCLEKADDLIIRLEPGQTLQNLFIGLEAGLVEGFSMVHYTVFNKSNPTDITNIELNFVVESKPEKTNIYSSKFIAIHDVYPNPVTNYANIDYELYTDEVKSKIVIHNILGNTIREYDLPYTENRVKILADELTTGIYFYTLYIDNDGVMTRKLIVKK